MSEYYESVDENRATETLIRAADAGVSLFDTADSYGCGQNELLVGRALHGRPVVVATKFGVRRGDDGAYVGVCGTPEYVRRACDASLRRLRDDRIELYQQHRVDPEVAIEETVGAMADLRREGKVAHLGLCEVTEAEIRRASSVTQIATVQNEYSVFDRRVETGVLAACEELGVGFVAYAPLGRGLLTGRFRSSRDFAEGDWRASGYFPRFAGQNLQANLRLLLEVERVAASYDVAPAQVALAWLLTRRPWIVPIPGTTNAQHVDANVAAASLRLDPDDLARIDAIVPSGGTGAGAAYDQTRRPA